MLNRLFKRAALLSILLGLTILGLRIWHPNWRRTCLRSWTRPDGKAFLYASWFRYGYEFEVFVPLQRSRPHGVDDDARIRELVDRLRNDDVVWTRGGIFTKPDRETFSRLERDAPYAFPLLFEALADRRKFAAAYMLLLCAGGQPPFSVWLIRPNDDLGSPHWDHYGGLKYKVHADGTADFDPSQIPKLRSLAQRFLVQRAQSWTIQLPNLRWFAVLPLAWVGVTLGSGWMRRRRVRLEGCCKVCGYDLRASSDRCPECGAAIPENLVRRPTNAPDHPEESNAVPH